MIGGMTGKSGYMGEEDLIDGARMELGHRAVRKSAKIVAQTIDKVGKFKSNINTKVSNIENTKEGLFQRIKNKISKTSEKVIDNSSYR